ncbi:phenylacetate--CoA ligase [Bradyrhizobium sp. AS23.2]|nr:phenylacetate--CoA ligase [Bradyrhizobium sp. AS23.2]
MAATFSGVETASPSAIRDLQEHRLRVQLDYLAARSAFYRRRFRAANIDVSRIRTIEDLARVPFTTKQDLRDSLAAMPPLGEHLAASLEDVVQIQASSGTTGSPSYVGLTEADVLAWQEMTARALFACGMRPGDLVLHGFSMSKGFVGGIPIFQAIQYLGARDIPIGADGGFDRLLIACRDLRPRCIVGTPNFLLFLAEKAKELAGVEAADLGVECLIVGGEPGGGIPAVRQAIEQRWNATCRELMGGTDLGCTYWAESNADGGMYMVAPDHILVELIDPESGDVRPFDVGATGELVYTALGREASPVLRFRSGDHVIVTSDGRSGGVRTTPAVRCFGRTDDMLIVRGVNLFPSAVQDVVAATPGTNRVMRVVADFPGHTTQDNLKVLVERAEGADPKGDAVLKSNIEGRIRNALSVKADVTIIDANFFEKPGARKVSLTLRKMPELRGM